MLTEFHFRGRTYQLHSWTGGDCPNTLQPYHAADIRADWGTRGLQSFNYIRMALYREALGHWFDFWGDLPDRDTRLTLWARATFDAWRTLTDGRA